MKKQSDLQGNTTKYPSILISFEYVRRVIDCAFSDLNICALCVHDVKLCSRSWTKKELTIGQKAEIIQVWFVNSFSVRNLGMISNIVALVSTQGFRKNQIIYQYLYLYLSSTRYVRETAQYDLYYVTLHLQKKYMFLIYIYILTYSKLGKIGGGHLIVLPCQYT